MRNFSNLEETVKAMITFAFHIDYYIAKIQVWSKNSLDWQGM